MTFWVRYSWVIHVLGWILFLVLPLTIMSREPNSNIYIQLLLSAPFWLFVLVYGLIFYLNSLFLLPALFLKKKYGLYLVIFLTGLFSVFYFQPFEKLIFQQFHSSEYERPERDPEMIAPPLPRNFDGEMPPPRRFQNRGAADSPTVDFVSLVLFVIVWVAAMAIKISEQWRLSERRAVSSEADKAQAELSFFKAQIHPHFLFNTLNNIYSLAVSNSENTAPSIMKLSKMMRYITEEATEDFVPVEDEIICLENYIDLQKLRLNSRTKVDFKSEGHFEGVRIAPLILMTFVENAFKFGVSSRFDNQIEISVKVFENCISFYCKNQIFESNDDSDREGIGIANTRKRLDFLYPDQYDLKLTSQENRFEVTLEIRP